jgi:predicted kinase
MLIVIGGLPGTGKTTLARELVRGLCAVYLRIDSVEQALLQSGVLSDIGSAGYLAGYAIAADNLKLGQTVVTDMVNPLVVTRDAWVEVASKADVPIVEIEVICSDIVEHRRKVESRKADIPGHKLPTWQDVLDRQYEPWHREHLTVDTANMSVSQAVHSIMEHLAVETMSDL